MRTQRSNGTTAYSYVYNGSQLSQMTVGSNTLNFAYDASGMPMMVTYNGTNYYYITNLQGDVMGIVDSTGTIVVNYTYDAWGKPLSITGSLASTLGALNPLRYRGYVYDTETGYYYLRSRYYDPQIGRFINADTLVSTGQGLLGGNMLSYCRNNPVKRKDATGKDDVCVTNAEELGDLLKQLDYAPSGVGSGGSTWASFARTLKYAADGLKMASGQRDMTHVERHHIISDKHSIKTSEYQAIADRYNYSLNDKTNIVELPGHRGRHSNAYHDFVAVAIKDLDAIAVGNADVFVEGMKVLGEFILDYPWLPYARYK